MRKLKCLPPCVQDIFEIPEGISYYEQLCNITGNLINTMNLLNETVEVTIPTLRQDMENGDQNLQDQVDTINNETIPELKSELENKIDTQDKALQDQIDTINDTTIPNLKTELENKIDTQDQELQTQIDTINETTIPELEDRLNTKIETADTNLQNQINTINQTTIPDLEERLNTKIEEGDSNLQEQITAVKTFTESQVNDFDFAGTVDTPSDTIKINKYSSRERDTVLANGNNSIHLEGDANITLQATLSEIADNYHDVTVNATINDKNIVDSNLKPNVKYANDNDSELVTNTTLSVANNTITLAKSTIDGGEVVENSNSVNLVAGDNVSISTEGDNVTISSTGGGTSDPSEVLGPVLNAIKTAKAPLIFDISGNRNTWSGAGGNYEDHITANIVYDSGSGTALSEERLLSTSHIKVGDGIADEIVTVGTEQYLQLSREWQLQDVVGKTIQYKFNGTVATPTLDTQMILSIIRNNPNILNMVALKPIMGYLNYDLFYPLSSLDESNKIYPSNSNNYFNFIVQSIEQTSRIGVRVLTFSHEVTVAENFGSITCALPSSGSYGTLDGFKYTNDGAMEHYQSNLTSLTNLVIDFLVVSR